MIEEINQLIKEGKQLETEFVKHTYDIGYNLRPKQVGNREKYLSWLDQAKALLKQDKKSYNEFSKWDKTNVRMITPEDHKILLKVLETIQ